jgi:hypothetical protein
MFRSNPKKYGVFSSYHDTIIADGWIKLNSQSFVFREWHPMSILELKLIAKRCSLFFNAEMDFQTLYDLY